MNTRNLLIALVALIIGVALGWLMASQQAVDVEVPDELITGALVADGSANSHASVSIPDHAVQVAPGLFDLGTRIAEGKTVQGYMIVDYKKDHSPKSAQNPARPECNNDSICDANENKSCADCKGAGGGPGGGPGGGGGPGADECFAHISKDTKWLSAEDYIVDPVNTRGLSDVFIRSNLESDISKWELHAGNVIGNEDIFGTVDGVDTISPDDKNEFYFADIESPGAIGLTVIWYYGAGRPSNRPIIEWDQVYDDVDFDWSEDCTINDCTSLGSEKMDLSNIVTHELGHSFGLADLYTDTCLEETMYGYSSNGETKKRSLEAGDIDGITDLYN